MMQESRFSKLTIFILSAIFFSISCSGGTTPIETAVDKIHGGYEVLPKLHIENNTKRFPIAIYEAVIDPEAQTFSITPEVRDVQYHFPLTQLYPYSLQITDFGFTPNFWADIKLSHPMPGSGVDAFDPRVIAILPANPGVQFDYPILCVEGNNRVIKTPDGYTPLFNELGGSILGNVNPFIAYFKNQPHRRWSSIGETEETKRWDMDLDGFGGDFRFKLIVDVSTNYPNPPQAVIDNAPEPVNIDTVVWKGLTPDGGSATISVTILDWQGHNSIAWVALEAPDLFYGTTGLSYYSPGRNPNEYMYVGEIANEKLVPEGEYNYLVAVWDKETGIPIYKEFTVAVSHDTLTGNLIWAKQIKSSPPDFIGQAITTLSDDSLVMTGSYYRSATFGEGEPNETTLTGTSNEFFVARYYPDGTLAWAKDSEGEGLNSGYGISTLQDNSVVATGRDYTLVRFDSNGNLEWIKRTGGSLASGFAVATLPDNSIVVTGGFFQTVIFGEGEPNETTLYKDLSGYTDIFVARYNADGTLQWAKRAGGLMDDLSYGVASLSDHSTVVVGRFYAVATFGEGEPNETSLSSVLYGIFIARYNPDGTLAWVKSVGGSYNDNAWGVTTLSDDSIVMTGYVMSATIFGEGEPNETILPSGGAFIARYNSDGTLFWAKRVTNYSWSMAITSLPDDSFVISGFFATSVIFGEGEPNETVLTSAGSYDIFIARYNPDGTLAWAKRAGGTRDNRSYAVTALSDDSTVATGILNIMAQSIFGEEELNETILDGGGFFIARYEP